MPDIVTVIDHQGHESIPIVGTLVIDPILGDYVRAAEDVYYIRPAYILRRREVRPQPEPEPQPAPKPETEQVPEPAWEVDPADPYAHLSPQTRRMLEERDRRQAEDAAATVAPPEPPKRKRGRPRKHA
jgi:hypothetical protein